MVYTGTLTTEYTIQSLMNETLWDLGNTPQEFRLDKTESESVCETLNVEFEIEEYTFNELIPMLAEFEHKYELSSVEMFSQHIHGTLSLDEDIQEWLSLFILYLGTEEVRQFSCP
jgi:hypothetical protein